jgi:homoserine kinase type II
MSVYTTVTQTQLTEWLQNYSLGALQYMQGILSGIENTNYFVTTSQGKYVLTLFEHMGAAELPYYAQLMAHLAARGFACPTPVANSHGEFIGELNGKPALLVTCLPGESVVHVSPAQCGQVGAVLAQLHHAGQGFTQRMLNPRGPHWWKSYLQLLRRKVTPTELRLIESEIDFQAQHAHADLPRGVIHGDLFRDNVLFERVDNAGSTNDLPGNISSKYGRIGGVIDFYFAGDDALLLDVAVTANDWCLRPNATRRCCAAIGLTTSSATPKKRRGQFCCVPPRCARGLVAWATTTFRCKVK